MVLSLEKPTIQPTERLTAEPFQRCNAAWEDYLAIRDNPDLDWQKLVFRQGWLWVDMGKEGPNHSSFSDLMTAIFFLWAFLNPEDRLQSYGRCLIEHPETYACAPDLVLYKGENIPRWKPDEPRRIDLRHHRLPDLVGEISDTSLSLDLDEQKQLYANLGVPEYWVIDVKGTRIFAFQLTASGTYQAIQYSQILPNLPIALLEQTLERLTTETNTAAANWFLQQLSTPTSETEPGLPSESQAG